MQEQNLIMKADIDYIAKQPQDKINLIIAGMTDLIEDSNARVDEMQSQNWFQRMIQTVTGKNKASKKEIQSNYEKLAAYSAEALSALYDRQLIDEKIELSLCIKIREIYSGVVDLKEMLASFVDALNRKIVSVDNSHMLIEEINQGVYTIDNPILSITQITSKLDDATLNNNRKMEIIYRELKEQKIINDNEINIVDLLNYCLDIGVNNAGMVYLELGTYSNEYLSSIFRNAIQRYFFIPDMERKFKKKEDIIKSLINDESIDESIAISSREIYDDFIEFKANNLNSSKEKNIEITDHDQLSMQNDKNKDNQNNDLIKDTNINGDKEIKNKTNDENKSLEEALSAPFKVLDEIFGTNYKDTDPDDDTDSDDDAEKSGKDSDISELLDAIEMDCENFELAYDGEINLDITNKLIKTLGIYFKDDVYLAHDDSLFHNGSTGFAITKDGIYCKTAFTPLSVVAYKDLANDPELTWKNATDLYADDKLVAVFAGSNSMHDEIKDLIWHICFDCKLNL